jgi:hypothetical protein
MKIMKNKKRRKNKQKKNQREEENKLERFNKLVVVQVVVEDMASMQEVVLVLIWIVMVDAGTASVLNAKLLSLTQDPASRQPRTLSTSELVIKSSLPVVRLQLSDVSLVLLGLLISDLSQEA